jgi:predicted RNA binding protein YcfA (HicA-like mRNA interferase family)
VKPEKLLRRLRRGNLANVRHADFARLVQMFGFQLLRSSGSHRIFSHPDVNELLNLQEVRGEVKPYQIRQFLRLVEWYHLKPENEP